MSALVEFVVNACSVYVYIETHVRRGKFLISVHITVTCITKVTLVQILHLKKITYNNSLLTA